MRQVLKGLVSTAENVVCFPLCIKGMKYRVDVSVLAKQLNSVVIPIYNHNLIGDWIESNSLWVIELSNSRTSRTKLEEKPSSTVKYLNSMVVLISYQHLTIRSQCNSKGVIKLTVCVPLSPKFEFELSSGIKYLNTVGAQHNDINNS